MLTGQNGILTQAQNAKTTNADKNAEEKIKLAVMAARAQSEGALDADKLVAEITNNYGGTATKTGTGFPVNATVDGKDFAVDGDGNITSTERKLLSEITGNETANTPAKDNLGNPITIPAGFEVDNPNDNVEDGIVVRDKTHTNTAGSEFVWIPVGDVKTKNKGTINIELNRYTFDNNGNKTKQGSNIIEEYWSEINTSAYGNITAKENIESEESGFRKSAKDNHGYYIGRYEARDKDSTARRDCLSSTTNQLVCTADNYVYDNVTQSQAATLSRGMYAGTPFESDLMNSYAWDTATLFLQTFDNRTNKDSLKKYSIQTSLNTNSDGLATQGTNKLDTSKQDKICNVYDMASNCLEWSTETYDFNSQQSKITSRAATPEKVYSDTPCTLRGRDYYDSSYYTSGRSDGSTSIYGSFGDVSFRTLLYL